MRTPPPRYLHVCQLRYLTFLHFDILSPSMLLFTLPSRSFFFALSPFLFFLLLMILRPCLCVLPTCFFPASGFARAASAIYERVVVMRRRHVTSGLYAIAPSPPISSLSLSTSADRSSFPPSGVLCSFHSFTVRLECLRFQRSSLCRTCPRNSFYGPSQSIC